MLLYKQAVSFLERRPWALISISFLILVFIYKPFLLEDPILSIDDKAMLDGIKINFFNKIDRQPIRDLSFHLDISLKKILPFWGHHLMNLVIFFLFILNAGKILRFLNIPRWHYLLSLYSFHPIFGNIIPWISARKHLLSALFISQAILCVLKKSNSIKKLFFAFIFFSLAILSHPIMIFWPLWIVCVLIIYNQLPFKNALLKSTPFFAFAALSSLINYFHYQELYTHRPNSISHLPYWQNIELIPFFFGRAFYNLILPIGLSYRYRYYSIPNLIGTMAFILFTLKYSREKFNNQTFLWGILYFISYGIFCIFISHGFYFDTYALIPSLAFFVILSIQFKKYLLSLLTPAIIGILSLIFIFIHNEEAKRWMNEETVIKNMIEREPQPGAFRNYATMGISRAQSCQELQEAGKAINQLGRYENGDTQRDLNILTSLFLSKIRSIKCSSNDIRSAIKSLSLPEPYQHHLSALLFLEMQDEKSYNQEIKKLKENIYQIDLTSQKIMAQELQKACETHLKKSPACRISF